MTRTNFPNTHNNRFCEILKVQKPLLMAPMFLVSNKTMLQSAIDHGIVGAIPSLNFLEDEALKKTILELNEYKQGKSGSFGINLIIKGNPKYEKHLKIIAETQPPLVITSLGNPDEVIELVHAYGGVVLCDVTNLKHAEKASKADGFIGVGQGAGGHAGNISLQVLIPMLRTAFPDKIILGAGGVANHFAFDSIMALGADGVSAGTVFIASSESTVGQDYKQAIIKAKASDITMSPILSGTPSSIIKSDYLSELEQMLKDKKLSLARGVDLLRQSGVETDYKKLFVAGQAVEFVTEESSVAEIIAKIVS